MLGDEENIEFDLNSKEDGFRYYKIIVKTMTDEKILHQKLDVYTNGLKHLFEMRRIHSLAFNASAIDNMKDIIQCN